MSRIILNTEKFKANDCRAVITTDDEITFSLQMFNRNKTILGILGKDHRKMEVVIDGLPIGKIHVANDEISINDQPFSSLTIPDGKKREHFRYTLFTLPHNQYAYRGLSKKERRETGVAKAKMGLYADQQLIAVMGGKNTEATKLFSSGKNIWVQPMKRFEPDCWAAVAVFFASTLLSISKLKMAQASAS